MHGSCIKNYEINFFTMILESLRNEKRIIHNQNINFRAYLYIFNNIDSTTIIYFLSNISNDTKLM